MARKRKSDIDGQPATIGHNGPMPSDDVVQDFTHRVENLLDELATEKGEYMNRARQIRDSIARVLVEAKRTPASRKRNSSW